MSLFFYNTAGESRASLEKMNKTESPSEIAVKLKRKRTALSFGKPTSVIVIVDALEKIDKIKGSNKAIYHSRANVANGFIGQLGPAELGAFIYALGGNGTGFNRKAVFQALAQAYVSLNEARYSNNKKKEQYSDWVYANIYLTYDVRKSMKHTCETLINQGVNDFPF